MAADPRFARDSLPPAERCLLDVLAGCASVSLLAALDDQIERERFVQICRDHAVHPLVAGLIRDGNNRLSPAAIEVVAQLESQNNERYAIALAAEAQLAEIADMLQSRGIGLTVFKGLALMHTLYPDHPIRRCFGDIDLLVPESRFDDTVSAFTALGYRLAQHKTDLQAVRRYGHKLLFVGDSRRPCDIDVHFRPLGKKLFEEKSGLTAAVFDAHSTDCTIAGRAIRVPTPELHLLYLCVHLSLQHHLASLNWLYDIKKMASCAEFDWEQLIGLANNCRLRRATWLSLLAARSHLDAAVPDEVIRRLAPAAPLGIAGLWFTTQMNPANIISRQHHYKQRRVVGQISRMYSEVTLIDRFTDRTRAAATWIFPRPMLLRASYRTQGRASLLLCYALHPVLVVFMLAIVGWLAVAYALEGQMHAPRRLRL